MLPALVPIDALFLDDAATALAIPEDNVVFRVWTTAMFATIVLLRAAMVALKDALIAVMALCKSAMLCLLASTPSCAD